MIQSPVILREGAYTEEDIASIKRTYRIWKTVDVYQDQITELFEIHSPSAKVDDNYKELIKSFSQNYLTPNPNLKGDWIYFPWNGYLVHMVTEKDYHKIRTNRNQLLVSQEEQERLRGTCIGFAGLSIGGHFAVGMTYGGIANTMKLAEFDNYATSNLNRVRVGIINIGQKKIIVTSEQVYDINPYANLHLYEAGLQEKDLDSFLCNDPRPSMVFEAIDDFAMKIRLRLKAREVGIPVIMLTNLGDNILIDVERYDLDRNLPLFNGLIGDTPEKILQAPITEKDKVKYAIQIVGKDHLSSRILETLSEINKTLVGRPQLYSTVTIAGGIASYLARQLLLYGNLPSGRTYISLSDIAHLRDYSTDSVKREELLSLLEKSVGI